MMAEVLRILNKLLTEHFERATERRQKRADEDYDEVPLHYLGEIFSSEIDCRLRDGKIILGSQDHIKYSQKDIQYIN